MPLAHVGVRIMGRAPFSSGLTCLQGTWMSGIARGVAGRSARPIAPLAAALGGGSNGGGRGGNGGSSGRGGPEPGSSGGSGWGRSAALLLAGGALLCGEGAAWAAAPKKPAPAPEPAAPAAADELTVNKVTDMAWALVGPILTNLGFSGCVGAAAGLALKKVGQFVAFCVGIGFLFVQGLAYTGFITVNWSHVHRSVTNILDVNKDGKVDAEDFKPIVAQGLAALSQGVPSVGGFLAGFVFALRNF